MATYTWSIPTGKAITGTTYIKDTDNNISDTMDDLVDFVNGTGAHTGQGLTYDLVDKLTVQTISGAKTFTSAIIASGGVTGNLNGNVTGNVTGALTGNSTTATSLSAGADRTKLDGIESGATADQTGAEIKALYEGQLNTNAYTDAEKTKLAGVATNANNYVLPSSTSAVLGGIRSYRSGTTLYINT